MAHRAGSRHVAWKLALLCVLPALVAAAEEVPPPPASVAAAKVPTILIDGHGGGRTFDGIGALSAGASSRLLHDYPEPERSEILDYLFKPGYGASLQILKVEIGGDSNSTSGAEPSHMRRPDDLSEERGYEWWLMKEAKRRNPRIKLWALEWCVPGWFKGGFWSDDNIRYLLAWLRIAQQQGLDIDYVGGWNERGFDAAWYKRWHVALAKEFPHIRVVGSDDIDNPWAIAAEMARDPELRGAVDIVGVHDPCVQRSAYRHCPVPAGVLALDKPVWDSEESSQGHDVGAAPIARSLNRQYIDGRMTANIVWSLVSAWYSSLPLADTGLMLAEQPWSGYYRVGKSIWACAHTAQFTDIGWRYIDGACGYLRNGTSYVTLRSPTGHDFTVVLETLDATGPQRVRFDTVGPFPTAAVHVWSTDLRSDDPADHFVLEETLARPEGGAFTVTLQPGHVYTLSTRQGHKGVARPRADIAAQMSLPYREDFERYAPRHFARYFSDLEGAFEVAPGKFGHPGRVLRQVVTVRPVGWNRELLPPTTVMGDPRWWGDYDVAVDACLEQPGWVELLGRISGQRQTTVAGYHFRMSSDGEWSLYSQEFGRADVVIARGKAPFPVGSWHRLGLQFDGPKIDVQFDGGTLATVEDERHRTGQSGLAVSPWQNAMFDNFAIEATAAWPTFLPQTQIKAVADSEHARNHRGYDFKVGNAIDERPETAWSSEWEPRAPLPQSLTLDLGKLTTVNGLAYEPRIEPAGTGYIETYRVSLSRDGNEFTPAASGAWPATSATKVATWPARPARYVRLTALSSSGGAVRVAELRVGRFGTTSAP